jgi:hypothetical protein
MEERNKLKHFLEVKKMEREMKDSLAPRRERAIEKKSY